MEHMKCFLSAVGFGLLLGGCATPPPTVSNTETALRSCEISQRTFRAQRDACEADYTGLQRDFDAFRDTSSARLEECTLARQGTMDELVRALNTLTECEQGSMLARREIEELQDQQQTLLAREADLRGRLKDEIAAKNVEIEVLKNRLSVRVLDKILFDTGSAQILPAGTAVLSAIGAVISDGREAIRVEGHTDDVPIGPGLKQIYFSNWELSGARAASVVRYFQHHHAIDPKRLMVAGFAYYRPVASNDSAENRQRNRRVEIVLTAPTSSG